MRLSSWRALGLVLTAAGILAGLIALFRTPVETWIYASENAFMEAVDPATLESNLWLLIPTGFFGGLIASLSPCILALLPANLSYIGTLTITSRLQAFVSAAGFVLGAVTVLSLFGLVSAFAGAVVVEYKGYVHLAIGLMTVVFGLGLLGVFKIRVPQGITELPDGAGPFLVGAAFALVTSPCASPVLFSLLLTAGSSGNQALGILTMAAYALGYTMLVFVGSLIAGFAKHTARLKQHSRQVEQLASVFLILVGLVYAGLGVLWFL